MTNPVPPPNKIAKRKGQTTPATNAVQLTQDITVPDDQTIFGAPGPIIPQGWWIVLEDGVIKAFDPVTYSTAYTTS